MADRGKTIPFGGAEMKHFSFKSEAHPIFFYPSASLRAVSVLNGLFALELLVADDTVFLRPRDR